MEIKKKTFQDLIKEIKPLEEAEQGVLKGGFSAFSSGSANVSSVSDPAVANTVTVVGNCSCGCTCKSSSAAAL